MIENLYPQGAVVFAKVNPSLKLVVRRYAKRVYYCTTQENPSLKDLVYFERELEASSAAATPAK